LFAENSISLDTLSDIFYVGIKSIRSPKSSWASLLPWNWRDQHGFQSQWLLNKNFFGLFSPPKNSDWCARFGDSPAPCPHIVLAANAKPYLWWTTNPQLFGPGSEQLDHSGYNYPYPP
jgi:hypothetical protein